MTTYDVIAELCKKNNLAITALERELGFGRGSIGKLRTGSTTLERLQKIADYFGVSVDYLLGKTDKKNNPAAESSKAILSPKQQELWELIHSLPEDLQDKATEMLRLFVESVSKGQ